MKKEITIFRDDMIQFTNRQLNIELECWIDDNNEPWFIGHDIATILGYKRQRDTVKDLVSDEDKTYAVLYRGGSNYNTRAIIINESGLYDLVMKCRIRSGPVKAFQKWVTHEVLPEIRKNQVYFKPEIIEDVINNPGTSVDYIERLKKENRNKDIIIEDLQEAKRFFDAATASTACCSVGTVAKHLSQRGYSIGAVRLFRWLRLNNFLSVQKHSYNVPLQWAIERGLFEVDMQNLIQYTTEDALAHVPMVTPKGQVYIINKFIKDAETKKYRVLEHGLDDEFRRDVNGFIHLTPKKGGRFEDFCKHRDLNK